MCTHMMYMYMHYNFFLHGESNVIRMLRREGSRSRVCDALRLGSPRQSFNIVVSSDYCLIMNKRSTIVALCIYT